ncbi:MAG TPA: hypothetical protein VH561_05820 [Micromonosporaceae bacterium]|jgi:hypothetical protein
MTTTSVRPAARPPLGARAAISAKTLRTDRWWIEPAYTVAGLSVWLLWGVIHTIFIRNYYFDEGPGHHYLTPFFSPCLSNACVPGSAEFGTFIPANVPLVPFALLSLPFLLLFRLTCYYYRRAYYRSFWLSPPACAVPDGHAKYTGETRFPLIFQNLHRYAFYAAVLVSLVNTWDAIRSFWGPQGAGFGLGNILLVGNVVLLWAYTVSCHSCRHIVGGRLKHFSRHPIRYRVWGVVSKLNTRHKELAWITLGTLALVDVYILALSAGWFSDPRFIN